MKNRRILVIDDNHAIHDDFRKILCGDSTSVSDLNKMEAALFDDTNDLNKNVSGVQFEIDSAFQGQDGLERVKQALKNKSPYAMAFVDVRMPPGWDGIETIVKIWECDPDIQIVICTAYSDYSWDVMNSKLGHPDRLLILKKPFDNVEVLQMAHTLTEKWHLARLANQKNQEMELLASQQKEELFTSEEHYRLIAENVADLIVVVDSDGKRIYNSPSYQTILGYSQAELQNSSAYEWIHLEDQDKVIAAAKRSMTTGVGEKLEYRIKHKDDSWHLLESHGSVALNNDKKNLIIVSRDITERKKAEQALLESEFRVRAIIEAANEAFVGMDADGFITNWNHQAAKTFGWSSDEVIGKSMSEIIIPQKFREAHSSGLKHFLLTGEGPVLNKRFEIIALHRNTHEFPIEITIWSVRHNQSHLFYAFIHDITERKKEEQRRQLIEIQLRQSQKLESIGQLASGIAHEINTPIQYIGDNTRFLKDSFNYFQKLVAQYSKLLHGIRENKVSQDLITEIEAIIQEADIDYLSAEIPKAIQQSLDGVERVAKIIQAMKEFSHPSTAEKIQFDIHKAIENTLTIAKNEWKYIAEVVTHFDPQIHSLSCLPDEFNQMILNMLVNAAHAISDVVGDGGGDKGTITISTQRLENDVEIRIADTGTGIPEQVREKIFDPFFTTKPIGKGTGQGLAIVHSAVKKHGGTITFETKVGKGTTFIIRLPTGNSTIRKKSH